MPMAATAAAAAGVVVVTVAKAVVMKPATPWAQMARNWPPAPKAACTRRAPVAEAVNAARLPMAHPKPAEGGERERGRRRGRGRDRDREGREGRDADAADSVGADGAPWPWPVQPAWCRQKPAWPGLGRACAVTEGVAALDTTPPGTQLARLLAANRSRPMPLCWPLHPVAAKRSARSSPTPCPPTAWPAWPRRWAWSGCSPTPTRERRAGRHGCRTGAVRVPREPRRQVLVDEGPLVLVETRKDLSQMKLPFEQQASERAAAKPAHTTPPRHRAWRRFPCWAAPLAGIRMNHLPTVLLQ
jgi:ribonuclease E